jgi:hypothetical protein
MHFIGGVNLLTIFIGICSPFHPLLTAVRYCRCYNKQYLHDGVCMAECPDGYVLVALLVEAIRFSRGLLVGATPDAIISIRTPTILPLLVATSLNWLLIFNLPTA